MTLLDFICDPLGRAAERNRLAAAKATCIDRLKLKIENDPLLAIAVAAQLGCAVRHVESAPDHGYFLKLQMKRAVKAWLDAAATPGEL